MGGILFSMQLFILYVSYFKKRKLRVISCNSGSFLKAEGKGRSREGFEDHTCFLISLKRFHSFSFWTSQLCLCGHSSHKCLSVVHGIIPSLACKTFPKKWWAIGLGPPVLVTFLKNFQWRGKKNPPNFNSLLFEKVKIAILRQIAKLFSRSLHAHHVWLLDEHLKIKNSKNPNV